MSGFCLAPAAYSNQNTTNRTVFTTFHLIMRVPMMPEALEFECTITSNPGINCSVSSNGSITIQTENGPIIIWLHRIIKEKRILIESIGEKPIRTAPSPSESSMSETIFRFAGNSSANDIEHDEDNNTPEILFGKDIQSIKEPRKSLETPNLDVYLTDFCQNLSVKIWTGWKSKKQKDKKSLEAFLSDWHHLFDHMNFSSPEQWSYKTVVASEKYGNLQLPFHKASLATWWNNGSGRGDSTVIARRQKQMVLALEPGYGEFTSKLKNTTRRQIQRYIIQGNIICLLFRLSPGLVITASEFISTTEYDTLWKNQRYPSVNEFSWLSKELIEESETYSEPVRRIFQDLHAKYNQDRSPAVFYTPQPSILYECGNGVTSLEDSIETSTNATKRRKTSRHGMSTTQAQRHSNFKDDQGGHTPSFQATLPDIHGAHEVPDITLAADILHSLQHGSHNHASFDATGFSPLVQFQSSSVASGASEECSMAVPSVAFKEVSNVSTEEHQASNDGSGESVAQSTLSLVTDLHRSKFGQQHSSIQLGVLSDGLTDNLTSNNVDLPSQGLGDEELESLQPTVADGLFLSDFMQEYQEIM
ncbi:hypothetical protein J3E74DRAFT_472627 [Bipolaris maydis]|nr:hypothetical protein J3E74DRAFT_472627 [Bipolaris maydis]